MIRKIEMPKHAHLAIAFFAILATVFAGIIKSNAWSIGACASTLALISLTAPFGGFARYSQTGSAVSLPALFASTTLNSTAASCAAFALGRGIGWFWGY